MWVPWVLVKFKALNCNKKLCYIPFLFKAVSENDVKIYVHSISIKGFGIDNPRLEIIVRDKCSLASTSFLCQIISFLHIGSMFMSFHKTSNASDYRLISIFLVISKDLESTVKANCTLLSPILSLPIWFLSLPVWNLKTHHQRARYCQLILQESRTREATQEPLAVV